MGKGFGVTLPPKLKSKPIISTLSPEDTDRVLANMYEFLFYEENAHTLGKMAIRRYMGGEGKGAIVAAPWQSEDPELIPTHYMVEDELIEAGLAFPSVIDSLRRYKPHSEFTLIYWQQNQPENMAACQVISLRDSVFRNYR